MPAAIHGLLLAPHFRFFAAQFALQSAVSDGEEICIEETRNGLFFPCRPSDSATLVLKEKTVGDGKRRVVHPAEWPAVLPAVLLGTQVDQSLVQSAFIQISQRAISIAFLRRIVFDVSFLESS